MAMGMVIHANLIGEMMMYKVILVPIAKQCCDTSALGHWAILVF